MTTEEYDKVKRRKYSQSVRDAVLDKTNGRCAYCGCEIHGRFALDHVVPLRKGGVDDESNLLASCVQCNHYKGTMTVEQFRAAIADTPNQLIKKSLTGRIAAAYRMLRVRDIVFYFETIDSTWHHSPFK